jgi:hypothetical protein
VRSIAVAGDVTNSVIVTGDDVTVELRVDGDDPLLAKLLAGPRLPTQNPRPLPLDTLPAPSSSHVGRDAEAVAVQAALAASATLEIDGAADVGKTFLVRYALASGGGQGRMRDGVAYVFARGKSYADVLQELFEAFFACAPPFLAGEQQIRRELAGMQALVVLDSLELDRGEVRELVAALPRCRFVLVARERPLGEGARVAVGGLTLPDAVRLVEQELGRPLDPAERSGAEDLWRRLDGHPFKLRQAAADVREGSRTFAALASALTAGSPTPALADLLRAELSPGEAAILSQLAALRGETLGIEHVIAMTGQPKAAIGALEARRLIASGSPRFRLAGALGDTVAPDDLAVRRLTEHLVGWARANRGRPATLLAEAPALLALWRGAVTDGRDRDVVELGRAIDAAFSWGRRWGTWGLLLDSVLRSALRVGDQGAEAWALHALGTRAYALGDPAEAVALLTQALGIRERLGDPAAEQATRHNLDFIGGPPPDASQEGGGAPRGGGPFAGRGRAVALGLALTLAAAVAAAVALNAGSHQPGNPVDTTVPRVIPTIPTTGGTAGTSTGTATTGGATTGSATGTSTGAATTGAATTGTTATSFRLSISPPPEGGSVSSADGRIDCPATRCRAEFPAGTPVDLTATPQKDGAWRFIAWSRDACGATDSCRLVLDRDQTLTATFHMPPASTSPPTISLASPATTTQASAVAIPVLAGDDGTWTGVPVPTFERRWQSCDGATPDTCVDIPAATGATYTPTDRGLHYRFLVTATNDAGKLCAASAILPSRDATPGPC